MINTKFSRILVAGTIVSALIAFGSVNAGAVCKQKQPWKNNPATEDAYGSWISCPTGIGTRWLPMDFAGDKVYFDGGTAYISIFCAHNDRSSPYALVGGVPPTGSTGAYSPTGTTNWTCDYLNSWTLLWGVKCGDTTDCGNGNLP